MEELVEGLVELMDAVRDLGGADAIVLAIAEHAFASLIGAPVTVVLKGREPTEEGGVRETYAVRTVVNDKSVDVVEFTMIRDNTGVRLEKVEVRLEVLKQQIECRENGGTDIEDYLKQYPELYGVYVSSLKYLPLEGKRIYVVPFSGWAPAGVDGISCRGRDGAYYVSFRSNPPSPLTFLHELIHVAGGEEFEAYVGSVFLLYAIRKGLAPFNLLGLLNISLEDVNRALQSAGFDDVEDYFNSKEVVPIGVATVDEEGRIRIRQGVPERLLVAAVLKEVADSVLECIQSGECGVECSILENLVKGLEQ